MAKRSLYQRLRMNPQVRTGLFCLGVLLMVAAPLLGPLPGPGVYARHNSIEYPALLPDGSIAEKSVSPTLAIRGVAVVENDGLRAAHRAAITEFVEVQDENTGSDEAPKVAEELADPGSVERTAIETTDGDPDTPKEQ